MDMFRNTAIPSTGALADNVSKATLLHITPGFYPLPVLDMAKGPKKKCCKKYKKKGKNRCSRCPGRNHN